MWNVYYDGVLNVPVPEGVTLVAYADDLALITKAPTEDMLQTKANLAIWNVCEWMHHKGLKVAPHKCEAVLLEGGRSMSSTSIRVEGNIVKTRTQIKYLGVLFGHNTSMKQHVRAVAEKAMVTGEALARIMPRVGGARASIRKTLASVVYSAVLYGAPIWADALKVERCRQTLAKVQRLLAIRIVSAYRTTSTEALMVLAGTPPIELMVKERTKKFMGQYRGQRDLRDQTLEEWQIKWENTQDKAAWTKRLIPDLRLWINRSHGELGYHLTQVITGHGTFRAYLHRFGLTDSPKCLYCESDDTAEHTLFHCDRWTVQRQEVNWKTGQEINAANMIRVMLRSEGEWKVIADAVVDIMQQKERDEREFKERTRGTAGITVPRA